MAVPPSSITNELTAPHIAPPPFSARQGLASRWESLYRQTPLREVPFHFANLRNSPFMMELLATVLRHCPRGGAALETGIGSGLASIWLSRRGVRAAGIDLSAGIVERARQVNNMLGGGARFATGDLFALYQPDAERYSVIHSQGVLEHFTPPYVRSALAQQVALAEWVVFSVPSVYYPFDPEFGDERLLTIEEWRHLLEHFDIAELRYHGDPQHGEREHILAVLRGQPVDDRLRAVMEVPEEPYPPGITAIVLARNEAKHIGPCLESLREWADEIIVCDMESTDETAAIARGLGAIVISHPLIANFDRARNMAAMRARYRWVIVVDADERVPAELGRELRAIALAEEPPEFAAMLLPFRHHFAGQWMRCLYPGYTAPRFLKNGRFVFNPRPHSGTMVDGRTISYPADDPARAIEHYSYDSLSHYLEKLNRYTSSEAANLHRDRRQFHWHQALAHFVEDFRGYYDRGGAAQDGVHGLIYTVNSAFYRWQQWAKLYEHRYREGLLQPDELEVPRSAEEFFEAALALVRQQPLPAPGEIRVVEGEADTADVVWCGPLYDPSGYGEECRNFVFALEDAGVAVAIQNLPWSADVVDLSEEEARRLAAMAARPVRPGFVQIIQNFPTRFQRHPRAGLCIGRTMFETDRLPPDWVKGCNRMDYVWVPSEFNRETFARAGVRPEKLAVVPGCQPILDFGEANGAAAKPNHDREGVAGRNGLERVAP